MKIKKTFEEVIKFLEANEGKKVSTLMPEILAMCESKKQSSTSIKDEGGKVLAIFCYYHKQWEIVEEVPYGDKKTSTTGLNTMCKVGVSKWTKQQSVAKKEAAEMLNDVAEGKVEPSDIKGLQVDIEVRRQVLDETDMPKGYSSEEDCLKALGL